MIKRNKDKIRVGPEDWQGRTAAVGEIKDGVLHNQSDQVLGFAKGMGVSSEVVDNAEVLGFQTVRFQGKDHVGKNWIGDVPVSEVVKCSKGRVHDWPECYYVPLTMIEATGKKPPVAAEIEASGKKPVASESQNIAELNTSKKA
jgi:hypothetical protein